MTRKLDPPDPLARVRTLLEQLNLTTAARGLADLLAQAETAQPAYSAFLHQILEAEHGARWERKLQRRRRWSKLGPPGSLDGFDWAARPQLSPQVVKELLTCRFVEEHRNVILVGRPSTGQDHGREGPRPRRLRPGPRRVLRLDGRGPPDAARRPRRRHLPQSLPPRDRPRTS